VGIDERANENIAQALIDREENRALTEENYERDRTERQRRHQLERQRMEDEHAISLLNAAAKLDAIAVANELRQFRQRSQEQDTQLAEEERRAQDQRTRELAQAEETFQEKIAREREFALQSRAEAIAQFNEQEAAEQEMRAIRAERQAEDDALELENKAKRGRLAQIDTTETKQRAVLRRSSLRPSTNRADANQVRT
jgi:hypothetical protein